MSIKKHASSPLALAIALSTRAALGEPATEPPAPAAPYELSEMECGELDSEGGLLPLRPVHVVGEDLDILCKVTVGLPQGTKGAPRAHSVTFTVTQGKKTSYQQVRDARVLAPGKRTILFVVPAEKLPTDGGEVKLRAELSRPAKNPGWKEIAFTLNAED